MEDIDALQKNVHDLKNNPPAGKSAIDIQKQIQKSLDELMERYQTYVAPASRSVPVNPDNLDFLRSYALNALNDAYTIAYNIDWNTSGKEGPLKNQPLDDQQPAFEQLPRVQSSQSLSSVESWLTTAEFGFDHQGNPLPPNTMSSSFVRKNDAGSTSPPKAPAHVTFQDQLSNGEIPDDQVSAVSWHTGQEAQDKVSVLSSETDLYSPN